jgi:predicted DNA-binding WGR domain protein
MASLVYEDSKSHKFWSISIDGSSTTINFGKFGTSGTNIVKDHGTSAKARKFMEKKIRGKRKKGYKEGKGKASRVTKTASKGKKATRSRSRSTKVSKKIKASKSGKSGGKKAKGKAKLTKKRSLSKSKSSLEKSGNLQKASLVFKSKNLKNNKYWKIVRRGKQTTVAFGRMGVKARKSEKTHKDVKAA